MPPDPRTCGIHGESASASCGSATRSEFVLLLSPFLSGCYQEYLRIYQFYRRRLPPLRLFLARFRIFRDFRLPPRVSGAGEELGGS
jgi:hypothetical protein